MNAFELLQKQAARRGDQLLSVFDGDGCSYQRQLAESLRLAESFPVAKGRLVGILSSGLAFQTTAFFAVQAAGGVPVILHSTLRRDEIEQICRVNRISWLLTERGAHAAAGQGNPPTGACFGALTSGSSGCPKVLLRSYESWAGFFPVQNRIFEIDSASRLLLSGPMSFTGNLNVFLSVLCAGGTVFGTSGVSPKQWSCLLSGQGITHVYLIPAKLRLVAQRDFPPCAGVKMIFTGSQLLHEGTANSLRRLFPRAQLLLYYGASELSYITYLRVGEIYQKPLSVGRPFPGVKVSVRDGLIYVDTPYRAMGLPSPCTVGDRGFLDEDGDLIFEGREGAVNRGGQKVSTAKVEHALRRIEGIADVAVLPYRDCRRGEEIAAFVSGELSDRELREQLFRIPPGERPRRVLRVPEIPLGAAGKPDLKQLRGLLCQTDDLYGTETENEEGR